MGNNHTPAPWVYEKGSKTIRSLPKNYWLATMDSWDGEVDNEANALHAVKCVNMHDELLAGLNEINKLVYATIGQPLDTERYFKIRDLCCGLLKKGEGEIE